jgi:hypothetical protein
VPQLIETAQQPCQSSRSVQTVARCACCQAVYTVLHITLRLYLTVCRAAAGQKSLAVSVQPTYKDWAASVLPQVLQNPPAKLCNGKASTPVIRSACAEAMHQLWHGKRPSPAASPAAMHCLPRLISSNLTFNCPEHDYISNNSNGWLCAGQVTPGVFLGT